MTERKYEIGRWYPHDGGDSHLPAYAVVRRIYSDSAGAANEDTEAYKVFWPDVVAFCVVSYPPEEKTRTGKCWAHDYPCTAPMFSDWNIDGGFSHGDLTVTTLDGEIEEIHWKRDHA